MIQHIQRVVRFHFLKVLFVDDLETVEYVIDNLAYKVQRVTDKWSQDKLENIGSTMDMQTHAGSRSTRPYSSTRH